MDVWLEHIQTFGPASLLGVLLLAIILGKLVPSRVMDARVKDKEEQLRRLADDRDDWKAAYTTEAKTNSTLVRQNEELLDGARLSQAIAQAIPKALQQGGP